MTTSTGTDRPIHQGQPILHRGAPLDTAQAVMLLVHGRGATAESILTLEPELHRPGWAYLAPQARGNAWCPLSFLAPLAQNEPYLSSALAALDDIVSHVLNAGLPSDKLVLLGFSQGACLALEYAARHTRRYGGLVGLSGGLIGPDGTPRDYPGSLDGTPVFLGCSDIDPHIPKQRVLDTEVWLRHLGADVTARLYPGMGHTINQNEIDAVRALMARVDGPASAPTG